MPKKLTLALVVVILCIVIALVIFYLPKPATSKPALPVPSVTVQALQYHMIPQTVVAYGQTVSPKSTAIKTQADGTLTGLYFTPGAMVKKGQLLFTLKTSNSESQLKRLKAQMQLSKQIYLRTKNMEHKVSGSVATVDLIKAKLQYQQDLASYQQAKTIYNIRAPISGVITDTDYAKGDVVNAATELATIIDMQSLQLRYQLPGRYIQQVKKNQLVEFTPSYSKRTYKAQVSYVAPLINSNVADFTVRANFTEPTNLAMNQFGEVKQFINQQYRTIAIKQELVQSDSQGFYVFVLKNSKVEKQYFDAGIVTKSGLIEVQSGLAIGTELITTNPHLIQAGQKVKVAK
jgi:RND family efflux transporter MFP subunit